MGQAFLPGCPGRGVFFVISLAYLLSEQHRVNSTGKSSSLTGETACRQVNSGVIHIRD